MKKFFLAIISWLVFLGWGYVLIWLGDPKGDMYGSLSVLGDFLYGIFIFLLVFVGLFIIFYPIAFFFSNLSSPRKHEYDLVSGTKRKSVSYEFDRNVERNHNSEKFQKDIYHAAYLLDSPYMSLKTLPKTLAYIDRGNEDERLYAKWVRTHSNIPMGVYDSQGNPIPEHRHLEVLGINSFTNPELFGRNSIQYERKKYPPSVRLSRIPNTIGNILFALLGVCLFFIVFALIL